MAVYPESSPDPTYPLIVTPRWSTLVNKYDSGVEQRRQKSLYPVFDCEVNYPPMPRADANTIVQFFNARKGMAESFYIFDLALLESDAFSHEGLFVDTGDGSTVTFDIPGRSTSSLVLYQNGSARTLTTHYTISVGTGEGNADQVTMVTAPAVGDMLSCDFEGYARYKVRFAEDKLPRGLVAIDRYGLVIKLQGVGGA
jgi:hypothetical protein